MKALEKKAESGEEKLGMLTVRMPKEFHRAIKANAAMAGVSMQEWVIEACRRSLDRKIFANEITSAGKLAERAGTAFDLKPAKAGRH